VVGASSGIGRAAGLAIAREGARVAFAARRVERLHAAVDEAVAGGAPREGLLALPCDVTDTQACERCVNDAAERFGGLDAIVYSPGIGLFKRVEELDAADWHAVFDVNVVGASLVARAALPLLRASRGKAVFFTSISAEDRPPRFAFESYVVTKVALESLVEALQGEEPAVGFTRLAMGDTLTEYAADGDPAVMGPIVKRWFDEGYLYGRTMDAASVAEQVVNVLASTETVRHLAITPRYGDVQGDPSSLWELEKRERR